MASGLKLSPVIDGPQVDFKRAEYVDLFPRWTLIRDVLSGDRKIKEKKEEYLPKPNPNDASDENRKRYDQYLERAVFYGVTGRTLRGMVGEIFSVDPVTTLPAEMDLLKVDLDGAGVSLDQQARKAVSHVVAYGRCGILTDYPILQAAATMADLAAGSIRPNVCFYDPWDIINWRSETVGAKKLLSLVVLSEKEVVDDDGFRHTFDPYYRVLRLTGGIYHSETWYYDEEKQIFIMDSDIVPTDGAGKPWNEIPFTFIGVENNDSNPDLPPMYDLAMLNVGHYRNSADYEESCYIVGQPTPWVAGLTESWVKEILKGGIQLGSRAVIPLPENGSAGLLEVTANTMPMEAMLHKESQMVALGAKLVEQKKVQRTATESSRDSAENSSILAMAAHNVAKAYQSALVWAGKFIGVAVSDTETANAEGKTISYELNTEFSFGQLAAPEIAAVIAAWQANAISKTEMRDNLRNGGIAFQTDEEFQGEVDSESINLGVPVGSPASAAAEQAKAAADAAKLAADAKAKAGNKAGMP